MQGGEGEGRAGSAEDHRLSLGPNCPPHTVCLISLLPDLTSAPASPSVLLNHRILRFGVAYAGREWVGQLLPAARLSFEMAQHACACVQLPASRAQGGPAL